MNYFSFSPLEIFDPYSSVSDIISREFLAFLVFEFVSNSEPSIIFCSLFRLRAAKAVPIRSDASAKAIRG